MKLLHCKMTREEFDDLPWQLGCKHEFRNGKALVLPAKTALVTMRLAVQKRPAPTSIWETRTVQTQDERGLVALYLQAFRKAPEYAGWPMEQFRARAQYNVAVHVNESTQPWYSASRVVREKNRFLGAIFIEEYHLGPIVQPIFVRPSHQRQGLATLLMGQAENRLAHLGVPYVFSHCHLANEASMEWHQRYGFEELPEAKIARYRYQHFAHEWERCERLQEGTPEDRQSLLQKRDYWHAELQRLETAPR